MGTMGPRSSATGHPWSAGGPPVIIDVEDPTHPSVEHLDNRWVIQDEIYQFTNFSRQRIHVILSLNYAETRRKGKMPDGDNPVAWCREFGKGKVFYTSLGHRQEVWTNPVYQKHLAGGILWALGIPGYEGNSKPGRPKPSNDWVPLFDGKTLSGWKPLNDGTWEIVEGGVLKGTGEPGHIFSPHRYRNFHYKAEARVFEDSNSGMYFRTQMEEKYRWPRGMEAQVNSSHGDRKRTGTLYGYKGVYEQLARPGEWFTQEVIAVDETIVIKVNGRVTVSIQAPYDQGKPEKKMKHFPEGHFAFQQHHEGSEVEFRNVMVRELP